MNNISRLSNCKRGNRESIPSFPTLRHFFHVLSSFKCISRAQRDVYLSLLSYFGEDGCFPSHAMLALESGTSERTVRNALNEARLCGWIDWIHRYQGNQRSSNQYFLTVTTEYVEKIIKTFQDFKKKTQKALKISAFLKRQRMPSSPYFYIKKELKSKASKLFESSKLLFQKSKQKEAHLSAFQRWRKRDTESAEAFFKAWIRDPKILINAFIPQDVRVELEQSQEEIDREKSSGSFLDKLKKPLLSLEEIAAQMTEDNEIESIRNELPYSANSNCLNNR